MSAADARDPRSVPVVRDYAPRDLEAVVALFGRSVREVASRDYTAAQVAVWAPQRPDLGAWRERLATGDVLVAEHEGAVAGFARLDGDCVDLLFVDPSRQRHGVARALLERVVVLARGRGVRVLWAGVSVTARPFFEHAGFRVTAAERVTIRGVTLPRSRMERLVDAGGAEPGRGGP